MFAIPLVFYSYKLLLNEFEIISNSQFYEIQTFFPKNSKIRYFYFDILENDSIDFVFSKYYPIVNESKNYNINKKSFFSNELKYLEGKFIISNKFTKQRKVIFKINNISEIDFEILKSFTIVLCRFFIILIMASQEQF